MDDRNYSALALAYQKGDQESFRKLVECLTRPLIAMAYRYTRDWEWARDLTQETWLKVHDRIRSYDPARSFRAWVFAVHRNGCVDHLRRAWVRLEVTPSDSGVTLPDRAADAADPETDLQNREFHERVRAALGELSEGQRRVFIRVELEQNQPKEVAKELGIKYTTLRATLHFARKRLATLLRDMEEAL